MTEKEFAGWQAITESSRARWTEDELYRMNGRGAMYFIGGEDGAYLRIGKDGVIEAGAYEGAIPHIGEAMFSPAVTERLEDYNAAFARALELGGKRFLMDMFNASDQNALVKAAWDKVDAKAAEGDAVDKHTVEAVPLSYQLNQSDMNEYGYKWPGMQPLTQEEALACFDGGHGVLLLYPDDTEGYAESREQIEKFDGIFGFEIPGYVEPEFAEEPTHTEGDEDRGTVMTIVFGGGRESEDRDTVGRGDWRAVKNAVASDGNRAGEPRADGYTSVLAAIENGKHAPKPPRKTKDAKHKSKEREEI
ncbi:hypothetical protein FACS189490_03910 [Clostridia bacterium]|nr:hypothetical protein FACS189490_03910 [Clostridia bacterium]